MQKERMKIQKIDFDEDLKLRLQIIETNYELQNYQILTEHIMRYLERLSKYHVELQTQMICHDCHSTNVLWTMNPETREIHFTCNECNFAFWTNEEEYERAIRKFPEYIFKR